MIKSVVKNQKSKENGYALPVALLLGVLMGIFALTMVMLLIRETKDTVATQKRIQTLVTADAAVDRAIAQIKLLGNWDLVPNLIDYRDDLVYTDIPGVKYRVDIQRGDAIDPPGNLKHDRTVTVRARNNSTGVKRQVQAVIARQPFTSAVSSEGGLSIAGKAQIFWGHMYNFDDTTVMQINTLQEWGTGYPKAYSLSDINAKNRGNRLFELCNEDVPNAYYFANAEDVGCEGMPNPPVIDWMDYRDRAENTLPPGCDWPTMAATPTWYTGVEKGMLFQDGDGDYPGPCCGADDQWSTIVKPRYDTLTDPVGSGGCGITGDDLEDIVVYIDTTDGAPPTATSPGNHPNTVKQTANYPKFRGTLVMTGALGITGGGGTSTAMEPPPGDWLPGTTVTDNVNFQGLIVTGGQFSWSGGPIIYGSVVSFGSFSSVGGIKIYYNYEFPYEGVSGGVFTVTAWREQSPDFEVLK